MVAEMICYCNATLTDPTALLTLSANLTYSRGEQGKKSDGSTRHRAARSWAASFENMNRYQLILLLQ